MKKFQAEAVYQEKKAKEMMSAFERTEKELNQRNSQAEVKFIKDQRGLQRRLLEVEDMSKTYEEKCNMLSRELQTKQRIVMNLKDELASSNERYARTREENERLFKRLHELEGRTTTKRRLRVDSLSDLTNIDLDIDIDEMGQNELKEYCLDLRTRFEKAVLEIRALKKELKESHEQSDDLELQNYSLTNDIEVLKQEHQSEISLLVSRLEHLTAKLSAAEKQIRSKSKTESREKRRSLSLKGRESFSINKEVEDKVTELEAKILTLEKGRSKRKYKRERSSERSSPIDDKSLRRIRRKSLDSATSSEPVKLLMRLSTLESQVTNVNGSTESLNVTNQTENTPKEDENSIKFKIDECLGQVTLLRNSLKRTSSPTADRLAILEQNLLELKEIFNTDTLYGEIGVINTSASSVVKQLQNLLVEKLTSLREKKRILKLNNELNAQAKLEILAEKVAYENILIGRIQEALQTSTTGEAVCERLLNKEVKETAHLITSLQNKLTGSAPKQVISCKTSAGYLSKILAKCLMTASSGLTSYKNIGLSPSLDYLQREQNDLNKLLDTYKSTKLPQLAEALATESLTGVTEQKTKFNRKLNDNTVADFTDTVRDVANSELIQAEISHVLLRAGQIYQGNVDSDHAYFFTFFASERAALELWSDSVGDVLCVEINKNIKELTDLYLNQLNKLQRQNWRRRVESERNGRPSSTLLLEEFADIVAHKALIDSRIEVLQGKKCHKGEAIKSEAGEELRCWLENDRYWDCLENQSVQINQSLEAEFACMMDRFSQDCYGQVGQPELEEVLGYLNDVADEVFELQKLANLRPGQDDVFVRSWSDVCVKCRGLRDRLEEVRNAMGKGSPRALGRSSSFRRLVKDVYFLLLFIVLLYFTELDFTFCFFFKTCYPLSFHYFSLHS